MLFEAQFTALGMKAVQNRVFRERPNRSPEEVWQATVDLVRSLVGDGLAILGYRTEQGLVWQESAEQVLDRLQTSHVTVVEETAVDLPWLHLTEAGKRAAQAVPIDDGSEAPDHHVRQWDWPFADAAAALLAYGTIDWIELGQIHWRVSQVSPAEPRDVIQRRALELIADLVRGGLAQLGSFNSDALGFFPWDCSLDEALDRIRAVYVDKFDDTAGWDWFCLLDLTRQGMTLARAIEAQTAP